MKYGILMGSLSCLYWLGSSAEVLLLWEFRLIYLVLMNKLRFDGGGTISVANWARQLLDFRSFEDDSVKNYFDGFH